MNIELSKDTESEIQVISLKTGLNEKEIIARAILLYLSSIRKHSLDSEMDAWQRASDEDSADFEKNQL